MLDDGTLELLCRRAVSHRADLEPDHLRQGDHGTATPTTSSMARASWPWASRGGAPLRARAHRPSPGGRICSPRSTKRTTASTAGFRSRSRLCSPSMRRRPIEQLANLHLPPAADCNIFISIPGTRPAASAIEESTLAGIPINVTLLFSTRAVPRRRRGLTCGGSSAGSRPGSIPAARPPSRLSSSAAGTSAVSAQGPRPSWVVGSESPSRCAPTRAYRELLDSVRWQRLQNEGARPQRLLWASTGTQGSRRHPDLALRRGLGRAVHDQHDAREDAPRVRRARPAPAVPWPVDGGDADDVLARSSTRVGVDLDALAAQAAARRRGSLR